MYISLKLSYFSNHWLTLEYHRYHTIPHENIAQIFSLFDRIDTEQQPIFNLLPRTAQSALILGSRVKSKVLYDP